MFSFNKSFGEREFFGSNECTDIGFPRKIKVVRLYMHSDNWAPHCIGSKEQMLGVANTELLCKSSLLSSVPLLHGSQHSDGLQNAPVREP